MPFITNASSIILSAVKVKLKSLVTLDRRCHNRPLFMIPLPIEACYYSVPFPQVHIAALLLKLVTDLPSHFIRKHLFFLRTQVNFDSFGVEDRDTVWALSLDVPTGNRDHRRHFHRVAHRAAEPFG